MEQLIGSPLFTPLLTGLIVAINMYYSQRRLKEDVKKLDNKQEACEVRLHTLELSVATNEAKNSEAMKTLFSDLHSIKADVRSLVKHHNSK